MKQEIKFVLDPDAACNTSAFSELKHLNTLINIFGLEISGDRNALVISVDEEKMQLRKNRKAGRKRNENAANYDITYGDIRKWRAAGIPTAQIIEKLHISRSTYFRRMREAEINSIPDTSPWVG